MSRGIALIFLGARHSGWGWGSKPHVDFPINIYMCVLNYSFSKKQCKLPEDDRVIETCRGVLNVLM